MCVIFAGLGIELQSSHLFFFYFLFFLSDVNLCAIFHLMLTVILGTLPYIQNTSTKKMETNQKIEKEN